MCPEFWGRKRPGFAPGTKRDECVNFLVTLNDRFWSLKPGMRNDKHPQSAAGRYRASSDPEHRRICSLLPALCTALAPALSNQQGAKASQAEHTEAWLACW